MLTRKKLVQKSNEESMKLLELNKNREHYKWISSKWLRQYGKVAFQTVTSKQIDSGEKEAKTKQISSMLVRL